ncbi:5'-nucleotidase C-terminal domain-containing protein [Thioalkalicoccus limnaeus]|uniref:5'-nucleotidase C-terminal domain-containing protein n=1 Tax=Thioalkalicoccus limnaeus TaxID=120681 RepID=A0ABV4BGL0_9GAMM
MNGIRTLWSAIGLALIATILVAVPAVSEANPPGQGRWGLPTLTVGDASAFESDGVIAFPLTLDRPAPRALRVMGVPLPKTAKPIKDFRPGAVSTLIPPGATRGTLEVTIHNTEGVGPDREFKLLAAAPGAMLSQRTATGTIRDDDPLTIHLLHINDHHSNLQPTSNTLDLGTSGGAFSVPFGGFPRITAKIDELASQREHVAKLHAGDAITGTLYYTLFKGQADADLMNSVCFDVFALGNHEFDDGDANLAQFLDGLNADPHCDTTTVAANVVPAIGTPLTPIAADDYIQPYAIKAFQGQEVAFIGIDIAGKTMNSSQPLPTTQFLDEVETTQRYVDELAAQGIDNIVLVTHYGYQNDLALAQAVTGVDAIIGGDSHTLLGDFARYGLPSGGPYPTMITNADGDPVCVAQAWHYSWVVGELAVTFERGKLAGCDGTPHLLLGDTFVRGNAAVGEPERSEILAAIAADPQLSIVTPDPDAQAILEGYAALVDELSEQVIGAAGEVLCERRVPNQPRGAAPCNANAVALSGAQLEVNGGFSQQVVTDAFFARAFRADLAIQNGGGVRIRIPEGDITIGTAYRLLPFSNTLVELELTGQEVIDSLEDALAFYARNPGANTGAFPYGSHIRWEIDMNLPQGARVANVEIRERGTDDWSAIELDADYVVVTNSFIASGRDGYQTFGDAFNQGRYTDTFINYAQGFVDYLEQDLAGALLFAPAPEHFSTQSFVPLTPP